MAADSHGLTRAARRRYDGSLLPQFFTRLKEIGFVNSVTLFGATFLVTALPLMILVSSFASRRIDDDLSHHLGLNARASHIVEQLFVNSNSRSAAAVALALLLSIAGCAGMAATIQEDYEQIFRTDHRKTGNIPRLLLWVAGLFGWLALDAAISSSARHLPAPLLFDVLLGLVVTVAFFWWSMHLLLAGAVSWRRLRTPAIVSAVFWLGLEGFAALYFSATITSDSRLYGTVGVVFSLMTWFIAIAAVFVLGALAGEVWQQGRQDPLAGGVSRGSAGRAGEERAAAERSAGG